MTTPPDNPRFPITINEHHVLRGSSGTSLFAALRDQHVFIPSACGGRGACGLCKVRVSRGGGAPLSAKERFHLTREEQQHGVRLSCQVSLQQDMAITIPEDYFHVKEYRAEVTALRDLTYDIREVQLRLIDPPTLPFRAGQYIEFQIPRYEQVQRIALRAYSIASPPSIADTIELEIRQVPQGLGSTYIFQHLKLHDPVRFHGPQGNFYVRESHRDLMLIAGGSGMAPMKSILYDLRHKNDPRAVRYFFGARNRRDLFLVNDMKRLESDLPDFKFIPALSQPLPEDHWQGETGLITEVVDRHVASGQAAEVYLCGSPDMINACLSFLKRKDVPDDRIYFDTFA